LQQPSAANGVDGFVVCFAANIFYANEKNSLENEKIKHHFILL